MEELFNRYNPWWEGEYKPENLIERPIIDTLREKYFKSKLIIFLTGIRRVGKTTIMKLFIKHLLYKENINPKPEGSPVSVNS